ncbi:MAG: hypothetical protein WA996_17765 [Candidatus Promineifilaceae bacterium]
METIDEKNIDESKSPKSNNRIVIGLVALLLLFMCCCVVVLSVVLADPFDWKLLGFLSGGAPSGQQGEIIGITAQIPFEEAQSGEINNMAYNGTVVVLLPDDEVVTANCAEEFLPDIASAPVFNVEQVSGGFVATITIKLEEHQNVLLDRNEAGEWEVTEVLE